MKVSVLLGAFSLFQSTLCLGFKAQIVNVPEEQLQMENFNKKGLPLETNYQSRIDFKVTGLGSKRGESHDYLVKKSYEVDVDGLSEGEYQLIVHSHDFHIFKHRYIVSVKEDEIVVTEDPLGVLKTNETKSLVVSEQNPLTLEARNVKIYKESPRNKLKEMVMQSPLGFIFRNTTYTILFFACMGLMIAPTAIQWFAPHLADSFNELQQEAYEKRAKRLQEEKEAAEAAARATAVQGKAGKKLKRR